MKNSYWILLLLPVLFVCELLYFRIADKFNIIDKPNERSLHNDITIRGGGIIFWISALIYFIISGCQYPYFFCALTLIATISFLDDIFTLSNRYRLLIQFISIFLVFVENDLLVEPNWIVVIILSIVSVGIVNAYNFMDGINGITSGYSSIVIIALLFVNNYHKVFIDNTFLITIFLGLVVFNFFNFRTKAACFAGDVGSISIAFVVLFLIMKLIILDKNPIYILFLSVYGVDSVLTILHRILLKQNIFKAHRLHLFQVIVHELKIPHLVMSMIYMSIQAMVCFIIIQNLETDIYTQIWQGVFISIVLVMAYLITKWQIMKGLKPINN